MARFPRAALRKLKLRSTSVFINCPFSDSHVLLFIAYVVGAMAVGLTPRAAIETYDARRSRLERIHALIAECAVSFHDISYVALDSNAALPRFNMPFELGMAVNESFHTDHGCYIFDSRPYQALATTSDLNGREILSHNATPEDVLRLIAANVESRSSLMPPDLYKRTIISLFGRRRKIRAREFFTPRSFQLLVAAVGASIL